MPPDRVERSEGGFDSSAMLRALQSHASSLGFAATAAVGRGLQSASKAGPELIDGAASRMAGFAGIVLSMPGDVPHDATHGYGASATHPVSRTALEARRDARTLAPAMPIGVSVQTVNCNKPPKSEADATRKAFSGTLRNRFKDGDKAQFIKHVAQTHPNELRRLGFSESQIKDMANDAERPENLEVHHRMPVECGGTNDFDNLTLVRKDVHDYLTEAQMAATKGLEPGTSREAELLMTEKGTMYPNVPGAFNQPPLDIPK